MTDSFSIAIVTERSAFMNRLRFLRLEFPVKKRTEGGENRGVKAKGKKADRAVHSQALPCALCRQAHTRSRKSRLLWPPEIFRC